MIKSQKNKCALAIVMSLLMALGFALMGLTGMTAYAATGEIGFGASNSATVTLTNGGTDTATVASYIAEGQYMLYLDVTDPGFTGEDEARYYNIYIDLSWSEGEETYTEYLSYNSEFGMYYTILSNIKGRDEITFSAYYDDETYVGAVTANVYLGYLAIGEFNNYDMGHVRLPAEIELQLSAGEHLISVAPYYYGGEEEFAPTYTVEYDGKTVELTADPDLSYTYTGIIDVEGTTMATIMGENAGDYLVEVKIYNAQTPIALPVEESMHMNYNERYLFSYTATKTGYQYFTATATVGGAEVEPLFSFAEKRTATAITSNNYPEINYPLYLTAGQIYYFEIAYVGSYVDGVEARFAFADWTETQLVIDGPTYLPVNVTGSEYRATISNLSGNYDISLAIFPEDFDFATDSMTVYLVKSNETLSEELNLDNGFIWSVDMTGATALYVTWNKEAVVGLLVSLTPIESRITVDVAQSITLPAGRDGRFYIDGLEANKPYQITLSDLTSENVNITGISGIIVAEGETQGVFIVNEFEVSYFFLNINNYNEDIDASFNILISEVPYATPLNFNIENEVVLAGYETRIYSIDLPVGEYAMKISGGISNVRAYSANGTIIDEYNDDQVGRLMVNGEQGSIVTVYIFFVNPNSEANNVNVLVTNFGGAIELETDTYIDLSATNRSVSFAMDVANGTYKITLYDTEEVQIMVGNTIVVASGATEGEFTINVIGCDTTEVLVFFSYTGTESVTFSVYVEQA